MTKPMILPSLTAPAPDVSARHRVARAISRERSAASAPVRARMWAWPGYVTLIGGGLIALVAPHLVHEMRYAPLVASLLLFGLPHGAVDHLVPGWVRGRAAGGVPFAMLIAGYTAVAALGVAIWLAAPLVALGLFLIAAVIHWGASELTWFPEQPRPVAFAAARGLVPVLLPALAFPAAFDQGIKSLLSPFLHQPPGLAPAGGLRFAAAVALATICVLGAGRSARGRGELAGLVAFFGLVEPVFAVGLYFIAWHSWRHIVRLATLQPAAASQMADGRPLRAVASVMLAALPCTLAAMLGLVGLAALLAVHVTSADQITAVALALIAALTIPHALVVAWLDGATRGSRFSDLSAYARHRAG